MPVYFVEWIDEFNNVKTKKFYSKKERDIFADEIFEEYPCKTYNGKEGE